MASAVGGERSLASALLQKQLKGACVDGEVPNVASFACLSTSP